MEGVFIYWFGWGFWVVISFFWPRSRKRFWSAFAILTLLILLPTTLVIANTLFHIGYLLFSIYLFWQMSKGNNVNLFHSFIASITIGAAYAGFQMMLIFDPVVEFIDSRWMIGCMTAIIAFLLSTTFNHRLLLAFLGLIQGELLAGLVSQHHLHLGRTIGNLYFFDIIAIVGMLFSVVWSFQQLSTLLGNLVVKEQKSDLLKQSS
ncbi:YphA family membrane protein [Halalkalibacter lacteus]|uniref:YphA family membrane protein n=1 Tax=Halalkalibacter lacteus TaxID=3090663 RepID=UPI002FC81F6B